MTFYSNFAGHYEEIFPLREGAVGFLEKWLPGEGRLLDLGCGTGRYCDRLTGPHRICEGADPDPGMIERARIIAPEGVFHAVGMEGLGSLAGEGFDGIFCIGNVLPHLPIDELPGFLERLHGALRPGGVWIFQTVNFDHLLDLTDFEFPVIRHDERGLTFCRSYRGITDHHLRFQTRLADRGGVIFSSEIDLYPRTSAEYEALHAQAGFVRLEHVADWSGRSYDSASSDGSVFVWRRD